MKTRILFILLFISSALAFSFMFADDDPLKIVVSNLERFKNDYPQEKVHLHLDKPYYTIGDSIWFKAYVVNAEKNELSGLSKILYVDLINEKDSVKKSLRLPITSGLAWGDFTLSDSLQEGNYRIRAYTNWMRNFGEEFFFDKTFSIGNSLSNTIVSNVTYQFSKTGNNEQVTALVNYSDLDGKPLANKELTYDVQLNFRNISKGSGITDDKGNVKISFVNNQPFLLKSGKINTSLKLGEKQFATKILPVKSTSNTVDMQFFPEGGQLVDSIRSRVAFKAVASTGLGQDLSGYIVDKDNARVAEFKSEHAGMGSFLLTPAAQNTYTAVMKFADGSEKRTPLPRSMPEGYVLSITNTNAENVNIRITASRNVLSNDEITLVAQTNGNVQYASKAKLEKAVYTAVVPKKRFPTGITQFTLFAGNNQPVAERLVFINHNDQLKLNVNTNKTLYAKREKVGMTVDIADTEAKPVTGSFSVAVTNMSRLPVDENKETTILSNLLLSSDIKGYIEEPAYYFNGVSTSKTTQLDNLMMTQGWRRFEWKNIVAGVYPVATYKPEKSIVISGRVLSANGNPEPGSKVTLFATGGDAGLLDTVTDAAGRFKFNNLIFSDDTKFVVQARNAKDRKNVEIEIDRISPQMVGKNKNYADVEINVNNSVLPYLISRRSDFDELRRYGIITKSILLKEVKVTEKKPSVKNSSNLNGAGNADAIIKAEDLQNCYSLAQCLQGRVAGLVIQNGIAYLTRSMSGPMQLIVDGNYLDPTYLGIINVADVESIEVLKNAGNTAIYGLRGGGGVLIINTKRGQQNMAYSKFSPGIMSYTPKGYYFSRRFYSPDYENPAQAATKVDVRNTVYWNPALVSDKDGKFNFQFFTSDIPGTYRTVIEGVNLKGQLARTVYTFTVK